MPIGVGSNRYVVRRFGATLDLKRGYAGLRQIRHVRQHIQILRIEEKGAVFVLLHAVDRIGACFLDDAVLPAAGLRAFAVVGVTAGQVG